MGRAAMNINKKTRVRKAKLIIANKKYSSWSLRPWLAMKVKGIEFEEELSGFDHSTNHAHFWRFSPTKKVPVLVLDGQTIWESPSDSRGLGGRLSRQGALASRA